MNGRCYHVENNRDGTEKENSLHTDIPEVQCVSDASFFYSVHRRLFSVVFLFTTAAYDPGAFSSFQDGTNMNSIGFSRMMMALSARRVH